MAKFWEVWVYIQGPYLKVKKKVLGSLCDNSQGLLFKSLLKSFYITNPWNDPRCSYFLGERTYKCFYVGTRPNSGYGGGPMYRSWHGKTAVTGNVSILLHQVLVSWSFCDPGGGSLCLLPFNSVYPCQRNPTYRHVGCWDTQTKVYSTQEKIELRLQQLKSSY
jgi:hypothetical protein